MEIYLSLKMLNLNKEKLDKAVKMGLSSFENEIRKYRKRKFIQSWK